MSAWVYASFWRRPARFHTHKAGSQDIQSCETSCKPSIIGMSWKGQDSHLEETLRYKRDAFSPELFRLLKDTQVDNGEEGEGLDFDPFVNGQDWAPRYSVRKVARKGATFLADVYGIWPYAAGPRRTKPDVAPELSFKDGRWFFVNFHYGKDPKYPMNESLVGVLTYPNADSTPPNRSRQGKPKTRAAVDSTAIAKQAEMKPPTDAEVWSRTRRIFPRALRV